MVVQEHVIGEDGGVPDAQPEGSVEDLHERHHLDRLASPYEPLDRLLDAEKHVPPRPDNCRREHRHAGVPIPRPHHLLTRHALEEDAEVLRDGAAGQEAGAGGGLR